MSCLMEIIIITLVLTAFLYSYFKKTFRYWKERNVPYEKTKCLFGNLLDMLMEKESLGKYFQKLYEKFDAPYFGIYVFNKPFLVVKDPDVINYILIKDFTSFSEKMIYADEIIDPIWSNLLTVMSTAKWRFFRKHLTQTFSSRKLQNMMPLLKQSSKSIQNYLKDCPKSSASLNNLIGNYTVDSSTKCFLGIDLDNKAKDALRYHIKNYLPSFKKGLYKFYAYMFVQKAVKLLKFKYTNSTSSKFIFEICTNVFKHRENERSERNDLINLLIELKARLQQENQPKICEIAFVSQAIMFIIASQETTTEIISHTLYELCINKKIQEQLRTEINEATECSEELTYKIVQNIKYLDMVVSETLRQYPVVNFLHRRCIKDYVVPSTGLKIDRGTNIIVPVHGLHFDSNYYFNPKKYDPERFRYGNINPSMYVPFGIGPRNCIGKRFALLNMKFVIADLIQKYKVTLPPNTKNNLSFKTGHIVHATDEIEIVFEPV
ncbi:hypothetical protein FQA39_LY05147 [Lamprigera yunnana]|nr:hypothetical protein FQA39_LY05147 [Lamprigera yunnana]